MTSELGQNVLLNVEMEPRPEVEPAQTLLLQTEELTVSDQVARKEAVTAKHVVSTCLVCLIYFRNQVPEYTYIDDPRG